MKKFMLVFVVSLFLAGIAYAETVVTPATLETAAPETAVAKKYICLMDGFESDHPGKCERCGMDLVETVMPAEAVPAEEAVAPATE